MFADERLPSLTEDLRFALSVLQEHSGLGLDPEYLSKIRSVILQQIERREAALNRRAPVATLLSLDLEKVAS
jgi:hypothetical protein